MVGAILLPLVVIGGVVGGIAMIAESASWSRSEVQAKVVEELYTNICNDNRIRITEDLLNQFDEMKNHLLTKLH